MITKMRILVSGGAGFIGSHLVDRLLAEGHYVIVLDNFFSGQRENLKHLVGNKNFELVEHDITNPIDFNNIDQIYHLACPASPAYYQFDPIHTVKTSVLGTINMLEIAHKNQARILFTSTSEIYGDPEIHPQTEEYHGNVSTLGPRACYDEGKRVAETLTIEYHRQKKVDVRMCRIFNTYGPRMKKNDGRVVSNFIVQALTKNGITVYGDGSQTRSFCFVDDLVEGIMRLMASNTAPPLPINLGNPEELTILQLAEGIGNTLGSKNIIYEPLPQDDPTRRKPDISKAKEILDWEPTVPLHVGLLKTIQYFQNNL